MARLKVVLIGSQTRSVFTTSSLVNDGRVVGLRLHCEGIGRLHCHQSRQIVDVRKVGVLTECSVELMSKAGSRKATVLLRGRGAVGLGLKSVTMLVCSETQSQRKR